MPMEGESASLFGYSEEEIEEHEKELTAEYELTLQRAHEQKRLMKELLESPAFTFLTNKLQEQIDSRNRSMLVMPTGLDDTVRKLYQSGEIAGLTIARDFAKILLDTSQDMINMDEKNKSASQ